jgi:hypothetical protein
MRFVVDTRAALSQDRFMVRPYRIVVLLYPHHVTQRRVGSMGAGGGGEFVSTDEKPTARDCGRGPPGRHRKRPS